MYRKHLRRNPADREERKALILSTLQTTNGSVSKAARILECHRVLLWYHLRVLGIAKEPRRIVESRKRRFRLAPCSAV